MNKDVIYIDIEEDITAIIGKVKAAGNKIVALVPPKRVGVLQSAVNLKLLQKAAQAADKRVVLITNDHSLVALAAGLKLPVAKNLQSRPEIPEMEAPEAPAEEIIDGKELPVGEVAQALDKSEAAVEKSVADDISDQVDLGAAAVKEAAKSPTKPPTFAEKIRGHSSKLKVPNFELFRKRVFIFGGLGVLLLFILIWAMIFAPRATVTISAKTTAVNIDRTLALNAGAEKSEPDKLQLKPIVHELKKSVATEFDATGKKDIGEPAKGEITVENCEYTDGFSIKSGTIFTAENGKQFKSTKAVSLPGYAKQSECDEASREIPVEATTFGPEYNISAQSYKIAGVSGEVDAEGTAMKGGTKETVTVVSQSDVDTAKQQLAQNNAEEAKAELKQQFKEDAIIIEESYIAETGDPASSPAVGEQATRAKLTVETKYIFMGLVRSEVRQILQNAVNDALKGKNDQQMYTLGENNIVFQNFQKLEGGNVSVKLVTTGSIGPKIDTNQLATQLVGKRFGEIQAIVNQIPGIDKVDIQLSPFWVTTAPSADKIEIKFSVSPNE
jgi:hypothetical protein